MFVVNKPYIKNCIYFHCESAIHALSEWEWGVKDLRHNFLRGDCGCVAWCDKGGSELCLQTVRRNMCIPLVAGLALSIRFLIIKQFNWLLPFVWDNYFLKHVFIIISSW